jgi:hypothetical protein
VRDQKKKLLLESLKSSEINTGFFYCPYVPLQVVDALDLPRRSFSEDEAKVVTVLEAVRHRLLQTLGIRVKS